MNSMDGYTRTFTNNAGKQAICPWKSPQPKNVLHEYKNGYRRKPKKPEKSGKGKKNADNQGKFNMLYIKR